MQNAASIVIAGGSKEGLPDEKTGKGQNEHLSPMLTKCRDYSRSSSLNPDNEEVERWLRCSAATRGDIRGGAFRTQRSFKQSEGTQQAGQPWLGSEHTNSSSVARLQIRTGSPKLTTDGAVSANIQAPYPTTRSREPAVSPELHNESRRALRPRRSVSTSKPAIGRQPQAWFGPRLA
jgi:hypothetical protein